MLSSITEPTSSVIFKVPSKIFSFLSPFTFFYSLLPVQYRRRQRNWKYREKVPHFRCLLPAAMSWKTPLMCNFTMRIIFQYKNLFVFYQTTLAMDSTKFWVFFHNILDSDGWKLFPSLLGYELFLEFPTWYFPLYLAYHFSNTVHSANNSRFRRLSFMQKKRSGI